MNDLDLCDVVWRSIGIYGDRSRNSRPYIGVFDGNDKVISNLKCKGSKDLGGWYSGQGVGFIGFLGEGGKVKNLTLKNISVVGEDYVGGVAGCVVGSDGKFKAKVFENCHVEGGSIIGEKRSIGGLIGKADNNIIIENCSSSAIVKGNDKSCCVGGLIGSGLKVKAKNCISSGEVIGGRYIGGILGYGWKNVAIVFCENRGNIRAKRDSAGGFLGFGWENVKLDRNKNTGRIFGEEYLGVFVGRSKQRVMVYNCEEYGFLVDGEESEIELVGDAKTICFID